MGHNWRGPAFSGGKQYHGTELDLSPGDSIPAGRSWISGRARDSGSYVHSTPDKDTARAFAEFKGGSRVYEVEHTGPTESDPNDTRDRRSRRPMRIVREVGNRRSGGHSWLGPAFDRSK